MDRHRQPGLARRLVDRPILPRPQRLGCACQQQDLGEMPVSGIAADLGGRPRSILVVGHDRAFEAGVLARPFLDLPFVGGMADGGRQIRILDALARSQRIEDTEFDIVGVKMLRLHERQRTPLSPPLRRQGIAPRRVGLPLRIGRPRRPAMPRRFAELRDVIDPAPLEPRMKVRLAAGGGMDIAIRHRQPACAAGLYRTGITGLDVHAAASSGRPKPRRVQISAEATPAPCVVQSCRHHPGSPS